MTRTDHPLIAAVYDTVMRPAELLGLRDQRRRTAAAAGGRVLEIGAGTGAMFEYYPPEVSQVVATEADPHMLERAQDKARRAPVPVELQAADAQDLPFDDASFDTVVVALALCTIPDPARALREIRRVLKPAGRLAFLEHVHSRRPLTARFQTALTPVWKHVVGGCRLDRDTVATIADHGFEVERVWRSGDQRGSMVQGEARVAPSPQRS